MAINTLKVATSGYLKRTTKAVLVIAVAGYLSFGTTPTPPPTPTPSTGGGGGGGYTGSSYSKEKEQTEQEEKIRIEDSEVIAIVELCLKIAII